MFATLKIMRLRSVLSRPGDSAEAFAAVHELANLGSPAAIAVLIELLGRRDGLARSAARELGRLRAESAAQPLAAMLDSAEVAQSASEALRQLGSKATPALIETLRADSPDRRRRAAAVLGDNGDPAAVEPLVKVLQCDQDYPVRTAAAAALGQLKDARGIWVLVGVLKLRDETSPDRQAALSELRRAAERAMRQVGGTLETPTSAAAPLPDPSATLDLETAPTLHPLLLGDLASLPEKDLLIVLRDLVAASEEISWANVENRAPLLPPHFASYDLRRRSAELVGRELHRRGGPALLKTILEEPLRGYVTLRNWWQESGLLA